VGDDQSSKSGFQMRFEVQFAVAKLGPGGGVVPGSGVPPARIGDGAEEFPCGMASAPGGRRPTSMGRTSSARMMKDVIGARKSNH
jgi:hypothetical protein